MTPTNPGWTRAHDRHLAEKCEGLEVIEKVYDYGTVYLYDSGMPFYDPQPTAHLYQIPTYNLDIAACIRAAEAWCNQNETRYWNASRFRNESSGRFRAEVSESWNNFNSQSTADTFAAALAWALFRATGGAE